MSDEPRLPRPGDVVGRDYRIEAEIGSGGMGAVYRARQERTGKAVALKWLRPKVAEDPMAAARFIREARASARVHHPNVVDIYGIEEQAGRTFLVLELLEGETLRALLRRQRLGVRESLELLLPVLRGVAAAHAQSVVHRDLKPDNIFVTRDPDVPDKRIPKVLDFGISKVAADTPMAEGTLTVTGAVLGTPHYMSLEQLQGEEVDARSDIYSLGVVLYECLTGKRPFESENFSAIVVKVATETPADPRALCPDMSPALRDVVLKAMSRHRQDRYQSVQELIAALQTVLSDEARPSFEGAPVEQAVELTSSSASDATRSTRGPERSKAAPPKNRRIKWALGALVSAAVIGTGLWTRPTGSTAATSTNDDPTGTPPAAAPLSQATAPATKSNELINTAAAQPAAPVATSTDRSPGADMPASRRATTSRRFATGWIYLGDYQNGAWATRYFDGWSTGTPAIGTKVSARGRSYVRTAIPDDFGSLASVLTTIGNENPIEVVEIARWHGGSYVWARVQPAW